MSGARSRDWRRNGRRTPAPGAAAAAAAQAGVEGPSVQKRTVRNEFTNFGYGLIGCIAFAVFSDSFDLRREGGGSFPLIPALDTREVIFKTVSGKTVRMPFGNEKTKGDAWWWGLPDKEAFDFIVLLGKSHTGEWLDFVLPFNFLSPMCFENVSFEQYDFDMAMGMPGLHTVRRKVEYTKRTPCIPPDLFAKYNDTSIWLRPELNHRGVIIL